MKKRIVKIIATVLSVIMLTSCFSMVYSISAGPVEPIDSFWVGDFEFVANEDESTCTLIGYSYAAKNINVVIPTYANGLLVTVIGEAVFENRGDIVSVSIPLGVETIGYSAFGWCESLETVSVSRVKTIEGLAFCNCTSLKKVVIPETVTILECQSYGGSIIQEGVNIVNSDLKIDDDAFDGCVNLTIYGYLGSTAEEFAAEKGHNFENLEASYMYNDMNSNHWWYDAISFVTAYDLLPGMNENGTDVFNPTDNMTRADAVRMLWAFEGKPVGFDATFTDVPTLYENAIGWAKDKGITSGITATTFGSSNTVTKVQLITFLYNYAQYKNYDTDTTGYTVPSTMTDFNSVPSYAQNAVKWAAKNNIITTTGAFSPNANATRAIAATVIYMFMDNVEC